MTARGVTAPTHRLLELFDHARGLTPAERGTFLAALAHEQPALARELGEILAMATATATWLERPAWSHFELPAGALVGPLPEQLGPFRVLGELGQGGMGRVVLAEEQGEGFRRKIALKLLAGAFPDPEAVTRFREEAAILASLEHPGIARLYAAGTTLEGVPYLALEYVDGLDLVRFARARGLSVAQRVELFLGVLEAVAYAHRHLVIHRDLKPGNILVDPTGQPKLLDFGIARPLSAGEAASDAGTSPPSAEGLTHAVSRWMTPAYASPEQLRGERYSTASDVFSLGVVLYELLAGGRPHAETEPDSAALAKAICELEPELPSTRARRQTGRPAETTPWRVLQGDLDAIVLKALRKSPAERYATAEAFGEDLRRYLAGQPVAARGDGHWYRWLKFVRRHRWPLAAACAGGLALTTALGIALWQGQRARLAQDRAERRLGDIQELAHALIHDIADEVTALDGALPAAELIVDQALSYLNRLDEEVGDDLALTRELASGFERISDIAGNFRDVGPGNANVAKGVAASQRAVSLRRRALELSGGDPGDMARLARALYLHVDHVRRTEPREQNARALDEALGLLREARRSRSADRELDFSWARGLAYVFGAGFENDLDTPADRLLTEAVEAWQPFLAAGPKGRTSEAGEYEQGLLQLSRACFNAGRFDEASWFADAARRDLEGSDPQKYRLLRQRDLSTAYLLLAEVEARRGRGPQAMELLHRGAVARRQTLSNPDRALWTDIDFFAYMVQLGPAAARAGDLAQGELWLAESQAFANAQAGSWSPAALRASLRLFAHRQGDMYRVAGDRTKAASAYQRVLADLEPGDEGLRTEILAHLAGFQ